MYLTLIPTGIEGKVQIYIKHIYKDINYVLYEYVHSLIFTGSIECKFVPLRFYKLYRYKILKR